MRLKWIIVLVVSVLLVSATVYLRVRLPLPLSFTQASLIHARFSAIRREIDEQQHDRIAEFFDLYPRSGLGMAWDAFSRYGSITCRTIVHGRYIVELEGNFTTSLTRMSVSALSVPGPLRVFEIRKADWQPMGRGVTWTPAVQKHLVLDGQHVTMDLVNRRYVFGRADWERLVCAGGDLAALGVPTITNQPVLKFKHFGLAAQAGKSNTAVQPSPRPYAAGAAPDR